MKKHDEGYILAYVFVILVVICLIATSVLSVPLANLKLQKAALEQMQHSYTAQGRIEQTLAGICDDLYDALHTRAYTYLKIPAGAQNATPGAQEDITDQVLQTAALIQSDAEGNSRYIPGITVEPGEWTALEPYAYPIRITARDGDTEITCEVVLRDVIAYDFTNYSVQIPDIEYKQYVTAEVEGGSQNGT